MVWPTMPVFGREATVRVTTQQEWGVSASGPWSPWRSGALCPPADPRLPLSHWPPSLLRVPCPLRLSLCLRLSVSLLSTSFRPCPSPSVLPLTVPSLISSPLSSRLFPGLVLLSLCLCLLPHSSLFLCVSVSLTMSVLLPTLCLTLCVPPAVLLPSSSPAPGLCLNLPIHLEETVSAAGLAASTLRGWSPHSPVWTPSSAPWSHLVPSWV